MKRGEEESKEFENKKSLGDVENLAVSFLLIIQHERKF